MFLVNVKPHLMEEKMNKKKIISLCLAGSMVLIPVGFAIGYKVDRDRLQVELEQGSDEGLQKEISRLKESIEKINQTNSVLTNRVNSLTSENNYYKTLVSDLREDISALELSLESVQQENSSLVDSYNTVCNQIEELEIALEEAISSGEENVVLVQTLTTERDSLLAEKAQLESSIATLNETILSLNQSIESKESEIASLTSTININSSKISELTQQKNALLVSVSDLESRVDKLVDENEDFIFQIATLETQIESLQGEIDRLNALLHEYEENQNQNQGYAIVFMDGDTVISSSYVDEFSNVSFATAPTKEGWTFEGWYVDGVKYDGSEQIKPTGNMTFKAQYYQWETVVEMMLNMECSSDLSTTNIAFDRYTNELRTYSSKYDNTIDVSNDIVRVRGKMCVIYDGYKESYDYLIENAVSGGKCKFVFLDKEYNLSYSYTNEGHEWYENKGNYKFYVFEYYPINSYFDGDGEVEGYNQYIERYTTLYAL